MKFDRSLNLDVNTNQTFARLALVDPLFTAAEHQMLQFLMQTRLRWITLGTAQIPAAALLPRRTITYRLLARNHTFITRAYLAWLIVW